VQAPQAVVDQQPQLSRLCQGFLPPLPEKPTTLEQLGDGLWVLRQPFLSSISYMSATCNSFVVALPDSDDLMVRTTTLQTHCSALLPCVSPSAATSTLTSEGDLYQAIDVLCTVQLQVISPVSQTEEAQYLQGQIPGRVKHIVCHSVSPEHWLYATQLIRQWPDATVWACPGMERQLYPSQRKSVCTWAAGDYLLPGYCILQALLRPAACLGSCQA
jgi:hypothetical protein